MELLKIVSNFQEINHIISRDTKLILQLNSDYTKGICTIEGTERVTLSEIARIVSQIVIPNELEFVWHACRYYE